MAPIPREDECPVCHVTLSRITDGSDGARESHVETCIESHFSGLMTYPASASKIPQNSHPRESDDEEETCPICHTSYLTEDFDGSDSAREAHFATCFESQSTSAKFAPPPESPGSPHSLNRAATFDSRVATSSKFAPPPGSPPSYNRAATFDSKAMSSGAKFPSEKGAASKSGPTPSMTTAMGNQQSVPVQTPSSGSRRFSIFGLGSGKNKEQKMDDRVTKADGLMRQRWGPPGSPTSEMVRRYWKATRMEQHWEYLRAQHPKQFKKYLDKGYMEPIPVCNISERSIPLSTLTGVFRHACRAMKSPCSAKLPYPSEYISEDC